MAKLSILLSFVLVLAQLRVASSFFVAALPSGQGTEIASAVLAAKSSKATSSSSSPKSKVTVTKTKCYDQNNVQITCPKSKVKLSKKVAIILGSIFGAIGLGIIGTAVIATLRKRRQAARASTNEEKSDNRDSISVNKAKVIDTSEDTPVLNHVDASHTNEKDSKLSPESEVR